MPDRRFLLVDADVLPEVFVKVLHAKELLASGAVNSISTAARQAGISRSAFYKYKDCVFDARNSRKVITVLATLLDETGALQALLAGISAAGGSVFTINQSTPESGAAQVAVSVRTDTMQMSVEEMLQKLRRQRTVVATLLDKTGALQMLLSGISAAGASIVTITQSRPENGAAQVEVTVRTGMMQMPVEEMLTRLSHQPCVVEIHRGA